MAHVYEEIYDIVRRIPKGRVLTYGVISHMIGGRMSAQGVGWALKALGAKKKRSREIAQQNLKGGKLNAADSENDKLNGVDSKNAKQKTSNQKLSKQNALRTNSKSDDDALVFDLQSVPWQRVVNSQGGTSTWKIAEVPPGLQQSLLESEGIVFDEEGKMDLTKYIWLDAASADAGIR